MYLIQHYVIKLSVTCSDLLQVTDKLYHIMAFSGYCGFLHQWNWLPRYNWHIVESGVKHHKPNLKPFCVHVPFVYFLRSIEKDEYNHITATYYLLAERKLKQHRQELQNSLSQIRKHSAPTGGSKPHLEPLALSPRYVFFFMYITNVVQYCSLF